MTQTINDNLLVAGDISLKASTCVSLHYGNRGRLGSAITFDPDHGRNGLWWEASQDGSEAGGLFCNGNTIVLWGSGNSDLLRVYDEADFKSATLAPKFVVSGAGGVGIGTGNEAIKSLLQIGDGLAGGYRPWMLHGAQVVWGTQHLFLGLKAQGSDRKDSVLAWGDNPEDAFRFISVGADEPADGQEIMRLQPNGRVGIGTSNPQATLDVNGDIKVKDWTLSVPDYVFEEAYALRGLDELREYLDAHGHLPDIPTAQQINDDGVNLGEFCMLLLKKVEELSLYVLQQHELIQVQNERIAKLEQQPTSTGQGGGNV
jgi:hypothetical protein